MELLKLIYSVVLAKVRASAVGCVRKQKYILSYTFVYVGHWGTMFRQATLLGDYNIDLKYVATIQMGLLR